ncbi:MAG: hypothetical protein ACOC6S_01910 [Chloroflexota bacterium]
MLAGRTILTNDLGSFTATFSVPGLSTSAQTVRAGVSGITRTAFFEVTTAAAPPVMTALASIEESLGESVWYFDNSTKSWKQYYVKNPDAVPEDSKLTNMEANNPYWIYVTEDTTLVYRGSSYDLSKGWNSVAWRG